MADTYLADIHSSDSVQLSNIILTIIKSVWKKLLGILKYSVNPQFHLLQIRTEIIELVQLNLNNLNKK